jgi:hypothetical protein
MLGLGVSLPMAGLMLMEAGVAATPSAFTYKPSRRGGGGTLRLLEFRRRRCSIRISPPGKDGFGSRIFYEPLAQWDADEPGRCRRRDSELRQRRPCRDRPQRRLEAEARRHRTTASRSRPTT